MKPHRLLIAFTIAASLTPGAARAAGTLVSDSAVLAGKNLDRKWKSAFLAGRQAFDRGRLTAAVNAWRSAMRRAGRLEDNDLPLELTACRLADAYCRKERYVKACRYLDQALAICRKRGWTDARLARAFLETDRHYKTISLASFSAAAADSLTGAGVRRITVIREGDRSLVEVLLKRRYVTPVETEAVKKIGFGRKVSFALAESGDGAFSITGIKGLRARTTSMWVDLLDSALPPQASAVRTARITAGKLGRTRTISVELPGQIRSSATQILADLSSAIKALPALWDESAGSRAPPPVLARPHLFLPVGSGTVAGINKRAGATEEKARPAPAEPPAPARSLAPSPQTDAAPAT